MLASKAKTLATINTWLAIFQISEQFCPLDSPIRRIRVQESIKLLQESLPSLEVARDFFPVEESRLRGKVCFEPQIADTMLKINELLRESKRYSEMYTCDQIIDSLAPFYIHEKGGVTREASGLDVLGLSYVLTRLNLEFGSTASYNSAMSMIKKQTSLLSQSIAIDQFGLSLNDPTHPLYEHSRVFHEYIRDLFESMNNGRSHWMNLVVCPRERAMQFNEVLPVSGRNLSAALS